MKLLLKPVSGGRFYSLLQALLVAVDIKLRRFYEAEIDLLGAAVKKNETALDVGANFGLYTYHLSRVVGKKGRVICFEPIPYTVGTLKTVVALMRLSNIDIRPVGLSDKTGLADFSVPLQENGHIMAGQIHNSDRCDDHGDVKSQVRWKETVKLQCPVSVIDRECLDVERLTFIKMDIEGAEIFALRGAKNTLKTFLPTLLLEINPWFLDGFRVSLSDLIEPLFELGYDIYIYDYQERILQRVVNQSEIIERNYFFIHPVYLSRFKNFFR